MSSLHTENDSFSDQLIDIFADNETSTKDANVAARNLHERHKSWVIRQVSKRVFNPADAKDIAQHVWMSVLRPDVLNKHYRIRNGRFRGLLLRSINWEVLNHFKRMPKSKRLNGKSSPIVFTDVDEIEVWQQLIPELYNDVVEIIIKPKLQSVDLKPRNVFVANDFNSMFKDEASITDIAEINGISVSEVETLLIVAAAKKVGLTDEEMSVYLPRNYRSLIDPSKARSSTGRYLSQIMGMKESAFRKYLSAARMVLKKAVRDNLDNVILDGSNHG